MKKKLEDLLERKKKLNSQIADLKSRKSKKNRAAEARKVNIIGTVVLRLARKDKFGQEILAKILPHVAKGERPLFHEFLDPADAAETD
ncbi:MAG: hypothetical protein LBQ75_09535 [Zoogloeaceae bacterium]|jgi:hypothetical protein|nr:hypothetical protein [Zoogloeaceae bacterium]